MTFEEWVAHFVEHLHLTHYNVEVELVEKNPDWNAKCRVTGDTRRVTISYTPDMDRPMREVALHEVIHILLSDLMEADGFNELERANERVTDHLTFAILGIVDAPREEVV